MVLAKRRIAVVQRRQALGDRERRRQRERRQALLLGRFDRAELRVAGSEAGPGQRVGRADALERVDRLAVATRREAGTREVAPEALGGKD